MIDNKTLSIEWLNEVSAKNRKADKILVEKVIRALYLLEGLAKTELDFVFKGGTALMRQKDFLLILISFCTMLQLILKSFLMK